MAAAGTKANPASRAPANRHTSQTATAATAAAAVVVPDGYDNEPTSTRRSTRGLTMCSAVSTATSGPTTDTATAGGSRCDAAQMNRNPLMTRTGPAAPIAA